MILDGKLSARVAEIDLLNPTLKRFRFVPENGGAFPTSPPGAHILVTLQGPDRVWQNAYSLVTPPDQRDHYAIIVRRVPDSRGGSHFLHDRLKTGDAVALSAPASLFPIASLARKHILIAGGIGLTPFLSYRPVLALRGAAYELHQFCAPDEVETFRALIGADAAGVHVHGVGRGERPDLAALLADQPLGTHVYTCGPQGLMDAVEETARGLGWTPHAIHRESFGGDKGGAPFMVTLARSGRSIAVGASQTLLEALEGEGIEAPCLCRGGACGVCLLPLVEGIPDHRDHVLSEAEKAEGRLIATCVSRARSGTLVLDF